MKKGERTAARDLADGANVAGGGVLRRHCVEILHGEVRGGRVALAHKAKLSRAAKQLRQKEARKP